MNASILRHPWRLAQRLAKKVVTREIPSIEGVLSAQGSRADSTKSPATSAGNLWDSLATDIVEEFRGAPTSFLRKPIISRTVHPNESELARRYFDEMRAKPFFRERILPRLHDVPFGDPYLCSFFPFASPMSMQHAYYLVMMQERLGVFPPDGDVAHILEIGGGYGNFCRIAKNFGYRGEYVIADLPEMHGIQQHYLGRVLNGHPRSEGIAFQQLDKDDFCPGDRPSLLMATFSLSEMPVPTRKIVEEYFKWFDYLFIAYNRGFDGVDNNAYFRDLDSRLSDSFDVQHFKDPHRSAWFLICRSATVRPRERKEQ